MEAEASEEQDVVPYATTAILFLSSLLYFLDGLHVQVLSCKLSPDTEYFATASANGWSAPLSPSGKIACSAACARRTAASNLAASRVSPPR